MCKSSKKHSFFEAGTSIRCEETRWKKRKREERQSKKRKSEEKDIAYRSGSEEGEIEEA